MRSKKPTFQAKPPTQQPHRPVAAALSPSWIIASLIVLVACLAWSCWPALVSMIEKWSHDPRYSHGFLVPMFALGYLWHRREDLGPISELRGRTWGILLIAAGAALQMVGGYYGVVWGAGASLIPYLAGVVVLLGGGRALRWAAPAVAFLAFMIPLPYRFEVALGQPLQRIATAASTYSLQTLGIMAYAEGNVIVLANGSRLNVVEACSGLSMLMTFIALSTAAALVVRKPLLDRLALVASAIPIALLANIIRITATGVLRETVGSGMADWFYHDLAGWLMIPLALVLLWAVLNLLSYLLIETEPASAAVVGMPGVTGLVNGRDESSRRSETTSSADESSRPIGPLTR